MSIAADNLEIQGILSEHPLAELLVEAAQVEASGSLRLSHEAQKVIVYLKKGKIVFAVSNSRQHRLFETLLQTGKISRELLGDIPNFTNDLEFSEILIQKIVVSKEEIDEIFVQIIEEILRAAFRWEAGKWIFSPLARIRENIEFKVDSAKLLAEYARDLSAEYTAGRFKSLEETFQVNSLSSQSNLMPQEGFILSRFEDQNLTVNAVQTLSGLPDSEVLKSLYILWLNGFVSRKNWNSAFTERQLASIKSARLTLKKDESAPIEKPKNKPPLETPAPPESAESEKTSDVSEKIEVPLSAEEYLRRIEAATHYYEMLDLPLDSSLSAVKTAYFALAKNFHPDKYHQESDSTLQQRIQQAFTEIAKAYETLKSTETRQVYDYKLRKNLEIGIPTRKESAPKDLNNEDKAKEEFEQGFSFLMKENHETAMPYLTRAVQLAPHIARYHAYFGKALSADEKQRFKADAEFQTAIRLEPNNPTFRLLLAEFYIQYNLLKRAEGELNRLLVTFPNNKEARELLDTLANK